MFMTSNVFQSREQVKNDKWLDQKAGAKKVSTTKIYDLQGNQAIGNHTADTDMYEKRF